MANELIKLCVDAYHGKVTNYSAGDANDGIRQAFIEMVGTDKPDYRTFRKKKNEIFEIIEVVADQTITEGFSKNDFFENFVEYRDLALGDSNEFYVEDQSLLTISKISGGHHEIRRQRLDIGTSFTISAEWFGVKIYEHFLRLLAGRIDWVAFLGKVQKSLEQFMLELVYTNFLGTQSALPAEFKMTGSYDRDVFLTVCDHVQASNVGAELLLVGTRTSLGKIQGAMTIASSEAMKTQANELGTVTYIEGMRTMVLGQVHKINSFDFAISPNMVMILPSTQKPIKLVKEGTPIITESTDGVKNKDMSIEYELQFRIGVATVFNSLYGMATIS